MPRNIGKTDETSVGKEASSSLSKALDNFLPKFDPTRLKDRQVRGGIVSNPLRVERLPANVIHVFRPTNSVEPFLSEGWVYMDASFCTTDPFVDDKVYVPNGRFEDGRVYVGDNVMLVSRRDRYEMAREEKVKRWNQRLDSALGKGTQDLKVDNAERPLRTWSLRETVESEVDNRESIDKLLERGERQLDLAGEKGLSD